MYFSEGWTVETLLEPHVFIPYNPDIANVFYRAATGDSEVDWDKDPYEDDDEDEFDDDGDGDDW